MKRAISPIVAIMALAALAGCPAKNQQPGILTPQEGGVPMPNQTGAAGGLPPTPPMNDFEAGVPNGDVQIVIISPAPAAAGAEPPTLSVNAAADVVAKVIIAGTGVVDLVDPASVRMTLTQGSTSTIISSSPLVGPSGDNQYRGKLSLAGLKSGDYTITISARSTTGTIGTAFVNVRVDAGPVVTVLSPVPGGHYKTSLFVQLAADAGPIGLAEPPTATIGGEPVNLQPAGQPNQFRAPFDLEKPLALTGDQLFVVTATNKAGTRTEIRFVIIVDVVGPSVTKTTPIPGQIVGGVVKFAAEIEDGAGLNESSLQVLIGDVTTPIFRLALKNEVGTKTYSVLFDTKNLTVCKLTSDPCIVRPTLSFRAADLLGNETTISYEFAVDNIPPIADLEPPLIHVWKIDKGAIRCSHSFDPLDFNIVAGDAPDDLCVVPQMFDLRARIEDDGNHATGLKQIPISLVDPNNTAAYILDTTVLPSGELQPLVVDTDNDGWCDAVNPHLQPTTSPLQGPRQVLKVRLAPVPPRGAADFATTDPDLPLPLPGGGLCLPGMEADIPKQLCKPGPQPSIAISYAAGEPAIWAAEPIAPTMPNYCFGSQLDTKANNILAVKSAKLAPKLGWKCIAIVTTDKNGNSSTSKPIRVYLDDYAYGGANSHDYGTFCNQNVATIEPMAGPPPDCTGTYDKASDTVSQKACKTRNFKYKTREICELGDCEIPAEFIQ